MRTGAGIAAEFFDIQPDFRQVKLLTTAVQRKFGDGLEGLLTMPAMFRFELFKLIGMRYHFQGVAFMTLLSALLLFLFWNGWLFFKTIGGRRTAAVPAVLIKLLL